MNTKSSNQTLVPAFLATTCILFSTNSFADLSGQQSIVHLAGYGDISYNDVDQGSSGFTSMHFNPIFLYQFNKMALFEGELETEIADTGETETKLEYANINLFLNNNQTLIAGKFLSPLGYFRQNLHPSWINKLPTAPPGFGHDGAAPVADIGLQLRGVQVMPGGTRWQYAVYSGNGPGISQLAGEIQGVESEGQTGNEDNSLVTGGRLSIQPSHQLEIGLSAASGEVALAGESSRDYSVTGADFSWQSGALELRGEYMQQEVGALAGSVAPGSSEWKTGYLQIAYRFLPSNWEGVVRYSDFKSAHADESQEQIAAGVNYLFAANLVGKLAYHGNSNDTGSAADNDLITLQLTYGF